ncbi:DEAD/DEAH box helicase [Streptomyces yaizuensis]|uniref:DEAD/DEAH box helicase n=1 Tax=Streptomyces yaizuensis TaxID=2989713 RepID=A0ABQ5NYT3_9ACTN|nr:Helicase associated domain protein [Streptomyces sp. YSPA8]GLF95520.1 DEAD/DEAH box helicase [Streptomyces sp. YSPA8]
MTDTRNPALLWSHQQDAVAAITRALRTEERVTAVMACGTGKTRVGAAVARETVQDGGIVLIAAPLLELLTQTVREWRRVLGDRGLGRVIAVCSDPAVALYHQGDLDAQRATVTADGNHLARLVHGTSGRVTIVCTYQSLAVITAAQDAGMPSIDLVIADEAHRTAGAADKAWAAVHDGGRIAARRRLNLTATPRIETSDTNVISMDDEKVFGTTVFRLPFGEAIRMGLLADYQAVVPVITDDQVREVTRAARKHPDFFRLGASALAPEMLATQVALLRAAREHGLRRMITFHNRVSDARWFATTLPQAAELLHPEERPTTVWADYVHGGQPLDQRRKVLDRLRSTDDSFGVVANSKILGEGVDAPAVDGIAFISPRNSPIDTVQAVGRALRLGGHAAGQKTASIFVPVHLSPGQDPETALNTSAFGPLWQIVRALAAHDDGFTTRLAAARSYGQSSGSEPGGGYELPDWIRLTGVPVISRFAEGITVRALGKVTDPWEEFVRACTVFREEYGHLVIRYNYITGNGYPLGLRADHARRRHTLGELPQARQDQLNALGMVWNLRDHDQAVFFEGLHHYKKTHGDLDIPVDYKTPAGAPGPRNLGGYVLRYRQGRGDFTSPETVAYLNSIGFVWDAREHRFQKNLQLVRDFRDRYGHADIPQNYIAPGGQKLGTWLSNRKADARNGRLAPDRIRALLDLGVTITGLPKGHKR